MDIHVDHISLHVHDQNVSARFYMDVLGFPEIENKTRRAHIRWVGVEGGHSVHLIGGASPAPERPLSTHLAFASRDFDGFVQHLETRGIVYVNAAGVPRQFNLRADGIRQLYFQDPDNHWIEVCEAAA